jgi:hypothetical protein
MHPKTITATCPLCCGTGTVTDHDPITGEPALARCPTCRGAGERQEPTTFDPPTPMSQNIVLYHSVDNDGIFSREIARRYFGRDAVYIGWNYGDPVPEIPAEARQIYMIDVSIEQLMADPRLIWIDHHRSAIAKYPSSIAGYRHDGVAASRLAWQYFFGGRKPAFAPDLPPPQAYLNFDVIEPQAVMLVGTFDVWDRRFPELFERAALFEHGIAAQKDLDWDTLLSDPYDGETLPLADAYVEKLLSDGVPVANATEQRSAARVKRSGFDLHWQGLVFLACNCGGGSLAFKAGIQPHHDGLLAFRWGRDKWRVSLYGVPGKPDIDFSAIAGRFKGGGGHKQSCGFECQELPFYLGGPPLDRRISDEALRILELAGAPPFSSEPKVEEWAKQVAAIMSTSAALVGAERVRQVSAEGYSADHDDAHNSGQLASAAACYANPYRLLVVPNRHSRAWDGVGVPAPVPADWPWERASWKPCPDDRLRELVKAGALIVAELDRLQRLSPAKAAA